MIKKFARSKLWIGMIKTHMARNYGLIKTHMAQNYGTITRINASRVNNQN